MKKFFKIFGISLASFLGLILVAICVMLWLVFTPSKITNIVNKEAKNFITCELHLDRAELTFFSTFPKFMLQIDGAKVINPLGLENDTLVVADKIFLDIDIKKLLKMEVDVESVILDNAKIFLYSDSNICNYDIIKPSEDEDTTSSFNISSISVKDIVLRTANIVFIDKEMAINAKLVDVNGNADLKILSDSVFSCSANIISPNLFFALDTSIYANNITANLKTHFSYNLNNSVFNCDELIFISNDNKLNFNGIIDISDSVKTVLDLNFDIETPSLKKLIAIAPPEYKSLADGYELDGQGKISGCVKGDVSDVTYPIVGVDIEISKADAYADFLPEKVDNINLVASVLIDMNVEKNSNIEIKSLFVNSLQSNVKFVGKVSDLFNDMKITGKISPNVNLKAVSKILPKDLKMMISGNLTGNISIDTKLSDVTDVKLEKIKASGKLNLKNLDFAMPDDTLLAKSTNLNLDFELNSSQKDNLPTFIRAKIDADNLNANFGEYFANLTNSHINASTGDIRKDISDLHLDFDIDNIDVKGDSLALLAENIIGKAIIQPSRKKNLSNKYSAEISNIENITAVFADNKLDINKLSAKIKSSQNLNETDFLLKYLASGNLNIDGLSAKISDIDQKIEIPSIKFNFTPNDYHIIDSKIKVGNSDFALTGDILNLRKYLKDKDTLKANLAFNSKEIDLMEIMAIYSKLGFDNEAENEEAASTESNVSSPSTTFLVPTKVDFSFKPNIQKLSFGTIKLYDFKGNIVMKNGAMILDNIDMRNNDARLNFTALYRSPRKNHLLVGTNIHLVDVEIKSLLNTIPDLDSLMPMLRTFDGKADFHIALQTNLDSNYNIKFSTLLGAASLQAENLVVLDNDIFNTLAKYLRFNKKTVNRIDSLNATFTIFKNEVDVYPILVAMDKYEVVLGGTNSFNSQNLSDIKFNYNVNLIKSPIVFTVGVDIFGSIDDLHWKLGKAKYAADFRPSARYDLENNQNKIRDLIKNALVGKFE